jgi:protein-L-isoaspartate O-methyltransferase
MLGGYLNMEMHLQEKGTFLKYRVVSGMSITSLCFSIDFVKGQSVLDIASGEGYGSAYLSQMANSVIGVDINRECIKFSRHKYEGCPIRIRCGSAMPFLFLVNLFDM